MLVKPGKEDKILSDFQTNCPSFEELIIYAVESRRFELSRRRILEIALHCGDLSPFLKKGEACGKCREILIGLKRGQGKCCLAYC